MWPGDGTLIATCGGGAEDILAGEVRDLLRAEPEIGRGVVSFPGGRDEVIKANRSLRTASRVLVRVAQGRVSSYDQLYRLVARLPWDRWVPARQTIAVNATSRDRELKDYRSIALKTKDAIVDTQRRAGARSDVDRKRPDVGIVVHVENGMATISLDSSGRPLHERGYRIEAGAAPMRESVAAAIVLASGWDKKRPFIDPFCGSGTIAIEAALYVSGVSPGSLRRGFAYQRWAWERGKVREVTRPVSSAAHPSAAVSSSKSASPAAEAKSSAGGSPSSDGSAATTPLIVARDIDPDLIAIAKSNAERAGVAHLITFEQGDFFSAKAPATNGTLIANPPYGERLQIDEAEAFYRSLGDRLKEKFGGWRAWVLSANRDAAKRIGLRPNSRRQIWQGGLDARLYEFDIYGGGRE